MMDYETFKELVTEKFLDYMPDTFKDYKVSIEKVKKTNRTLDGIQLSSPGNKEKEVKPTIYIDHMYEQYRQGEGFNRVVMDAADSIAAAYERLPQDHAKFDISSAKEKITMELINTEQNREILEKTPHREFCDLSIVYRIVTGIDKNGIYSAMINDALAEELGMEEQQLYEAAFVNTKRIYPPLIQSMKEAVWEIYRSNGMSIEDAEEMISGMKDVDMYVITNTREINGAVSMLYEEELHALAEELGENLYILPSSRHEVIAIPVSARTPDDLARMVEDVNMTKVDLADRLSNQVYRYDKNKRELTLATDTPSKRLDGIVTEISMQGPDRQR